MTSVYPNPQEGLIVCFDYLWKREADKGREEGSKDRPCLVLCLTGEGKSQKACFLPITHSEPADKRSAVEIPQAVKQRLGLDGMKSWIVLTEHNISGFPSMYMRPISNKGPKKYDYGVLPSGLLQTVRQRVDELRRSGEFQNVSRWELKR